MILNAIIQKTKEKTIPNKRNQKKIILLKKNYSDISIFTKKKSSLTKNDFTPTAKKKKLLILQSKMNYLLNQPSIKTSREIEKKFYLRNREDMKNLGRSSELFSGVIKAQDKIVKKILLDYKNIQSYDKEILSNNRSNYNRNVEYMENQKKVKEAQRLRESSKFELLKHAENDKKIFISAYKHKNKDSFHSSLYSSPKYIPIKKMPSFIHRREKEFKLEEKVNDILIQKKYLYYVRLKENAKKFCDRIRGLDLDCKLYEPMNKFNSKKNVERNVLFNLGNLDRIVKLESIKDNGFIDEDYEGSSIFLKKCSEDYNIYCDKAISGYFPRYVKKNGFLNRTMIKYSNLQGKFFGLPV